MTGLPSGTVTFLFTDVEGSTRLWAADTEAMSASLVVHDAILRGAIEGNAGYVFATAGDSFAAAFSRASDAVRAATESQQALAAAEWPGPQLRVRMGLHLGEAEERGGDYFGPAVNTAARVEAAGHGGQVLITEPVRLAAGVSDVTDLGVRHLRDVAEPLRLFQLGAGSFPALRVVDPSMSNLPVRPTRLIGREAEVARVRGLLAEGRLVTVTAVGGSGKTRLAIAVGEAELPHRRAGVWFVDLTAVSNGADVVSAIANGLGLNLVAGDALTQVLTFMADKHALVILDNCEHVIEEAAAFVEAFLSTNSPALILATSREALDIDGERTVVLGSLPSESADSPAVRLFVDRATGVFGDFALTDTNAPAVSAICTRLDGMPLAIELAAARVTVMSPQELLAGLDDRFALLSGGRRRSRQRTLEATLDWSYDLLDAQEQRVLRALGVFVDGFDIEAVAGVTGLDRRRASGCVEALQAKSLVVRADKGTATRFRLLETVKAYAEDRLVDAGEAITVRDLHLAHFHTLAMAEGRRAWGSLDIGLRLRRDCPNITAAFEWAADRQRWVTAGELLIGSQAAYYLDLRPFELAEALARVAVHLGVLDPELLGYVSMQRWYLTVILADITAMLGANEELRRSQLSIFRALGWTTFAFMLTFIGAEPDGQLLARAEHERNLSAPPQSADSNAHTFAAVLPAVVHQAAAFHAGDFERARETCRELLQSVMGRSTSMTEQVVGLALCEIALGEPNAALAAVGQLDELDLPAVDGTEVRALAYLALGNTEAATECVRRLALRAATGQWPVESNDAMLVLAALSHHEGDDDAARRHLLNAGLGRSPATMGICRHLARELDIADEHAAAVADIGRPDNPHGGLGATRSMHALRAELRRRGWD